MKLNDTQIRASKPRPKDYKLSDRRGLAHKGSCRFVPAEVRGGDVRLSGNGPGATRVRYCWGCRARLQPVRRSRAAGRIVRYGHRRRKLTGC